MVSFCVLRRVLKTDLESTKISLTSALTAWFIEWIAKVNVFLEKTNENKHPRHYIKLFCSLLIHHCKMSSQVSIRLVGFVALIRLSLTVWQGKRLNSSCLPGQPVKLSRITATKPKSQLNKSIRLAKTFQQFGFSTLSRQTNWQVEWILD